MDEEIPAYVVKMFNEWKVEHEMEYELGEEYGKL